MDIRNVTVKFLRSDGREFIVDNIDYLITNIDGIDGVKNVIYSEKNAVGNGVTITGKQAIPKDFSLSCDTKEPLLNYLYRKAVVSFFNVKYTYKIFVNYLGTEKWCNAEIYEINAPSGNTYQSFTFSVQFLRDEAYWRSVDEFAKDIASVDPRYGYPLYDISDMGTLYDVFNFAKNVEIDNDGDVECFFTAVIEAKNTVKNPKLIKDGKFIKILDTMKTNDIYIIDFAKPSITKNGLNAINLVDKASNFTEINFDVGKNIISFAADIGENVMKVTLFFNKLYGGI